MRLSVALLVAVVAALWCAVGYAQPDVSDESDSPGSAESKAADSPEAADESPNAPKSDEQEAQGETSADSTERPTTTPPMDGATYVVRMRDLAQRIDELKEQIRRSHTRLSLLSDTILSGGVGGARAEIAFVNDMSSAFRLTKALFVLDGAVQYNKEKGYDVKTSVIPPEYTP